MSNEQKNPQKKKHPQNKERNLKHLRLVGLTGGIGSGKSLVAKLFLTHNVTVKDADQITRDLVAKGQPALQKIVEHFGEQILYPDGSLNRTKLKNQIFQSESERIWLEELLHPLVKQEILFLKEQVPIGKYWVIAIPLLVETHFETAVDRVLVVDCPIEQQIARVMKRDGIPRSDIEAIINIQAKREYRLSKADDIIINNGTESELEAQVLDLHQKYSLLTN